MGSEVVDYYKILQCDRSAPLEHLKKSYQRLVLTSHPDKNNSGEDYENFLNIQKAWSVLKDPQSRKQYDALLSSEEHRGILLHDSVSLRDFQYDDFKCIYSYKCRCGGLYSVTLKETVQPEIVVECDECSLSIKIDVPPCAKTYNRIHQIFSSIR